MTRPKSPTMRCRTERQTRSGEAPGQGQEQEPPGDEPGDGARCTSCRLAVTADVDRPQPKRGVATPTTSPAAPDNSSGRVAPDNNTGHRADVYCQFGSPNCAGKRNCRIGSPNCTETRNCQSGNSAGQRIRSGRHPETCGLQRGH